MKKYLNWKKVIATSVIGLILGMSLSACSSNNQTTFNNEQKAVESKDDKFTPFELETYHTVVQYTKVPQKVVSFNTHTTENLFALGLEDKIIGTSFKSGEILPKYQKKFDKIPVLAEKYPSMEALLGANPDFVYGRSSAFEEKGAGTVQDMLDNGIIAYVSKATYTEGATIEDTYEDFYNLGKIFNVEDRADKIVNQMKTKVKKVQEQTSKVDEKLRVFVYDSGSDQAYTAGKSLESNIIELAGGQNIFSDLNKTWEKVNWEAVVQRNPQCIIINDYEEVSAEEKIKFLKSNAALSGIDAIKNDNFVVVQLPSVFTGIRNADAVENLAREFYPDLF
ncbi:ABC transporter substrate-binding protein [Inediibacterium massiliense]|uniref:ABC transporter substrate-binding protein n=1 Tax=Inediibacterium massiliense TaxID=1658111 RepID=UPI0006B51DD1|nr:ABC transporter substrate-binding protein [Inediibacterium massiliense]